MALGPLLLGRAGDQLRPQTPSSWRWGSGSGLEGSLDAPADRVPRDCWDARVTEGAGWQSTCGTHVCKEPVHFPAGDNSNDRPTDRQTERAVRSQGPENQGATGREISSSSPTGRN